MLSPAARGDPPPPLAVFVVHRERDPLNDHYHNTGTIFVGDHRLPSASHTRAWFRRHGYTVTVHYFSTQADAVTRFPTACLDIGDAIRSEGARILADEAALHPAAVTWPRPPDAAPAVPRPDLQGTTAFNSPSFPSPALRSPVPPPHVNAWAPPPAHGGLPAPGGSI